MNHPTIQNTLHRHTGKPFSVRHDRQSGLAERQLDGTAVQNAINSIAGRKPGFRVRTWWWFHLACTGYANIVLFRFGISIAAYTDPYLMRMVVATVRPDDVVIVISATGRTRELVELVEVAQRYSATVIALTKPGSDLAKVADLSLTVEVPEIVNVLKPTGFAICISCGA